MNTPHLKTFDWRTSDSRIWEMEVSIRNSSGSELFFDASEIRSFTIEDSFLDWPTLRGNITVASNFEVLERGTALRKPYVFRNDGRDELSIYLTPFKSQETVTPKPEIWTIDTVFSIYDREDIPTPNITNKLKKFHFWDKRFQLMSETNLAWSTATAIVKNGEKRPPSYNPRHASDDRRTLRTGDAIQHVIEQMGYQVNKTLWDRGSTKILYTSPANFNVNEDISYLLDRHLSELNRDICQFGLDTRLQDAEFTLYPINQYFAKAGRTLPGAYQLEQFVLESNGSSKYTNPRKGPVAPLDENDPNKSYIGSDNVIRTYEYVDMAGFDNTKAIVSKPVHSYDFRNKRFVVDFKDHEIQNVRDEFTQKYLTGKITGRNNKPVSLMTLNDEKKNQKSIEPVYSLYADKNSRLAHGLGTLLYSGLFLNQFIRFRVMGATNRLAGRFINIDYIDISDDPLDYKLLGQWFVIRVLHIYNMGRYENQIEAIKVHSYDKVIEKE